MIPILLYAGLWLGARWARGLNAYGWLVALAYALILLALFGVTT